MEKKTTVELLQRLKKIEIEKWNLGVEATQIMEEIWKRVEPLNVEKTKPLEKKK